MGLLPHPPYVRVCVKSTSDHMTMRWEGGGGGGGGRGGGGGGGEGRFGFILVELARLVMITWNVALAFMGTSHMWMVMHVHMYMVITERHCEECLH